MDDRKADAVAHLAVARTQNTGNGILGSYKRERRPSCTTAFCNGDKSKFGFAPELGSRLQSRYEPLVIPVIQMKLNGIMM